MNGYWTGLPQVPSTGLPLEDNAVSLTSPVSRQKDVLDCVLVSLFRFRVPVGVVSIATTKNVLRPALLVGSGLPVEDVGGYTRA